MRVVEDLVNRAGHISADYRADGSVMLASLIVARRDAVAIEARLVPELALDGAAANEGEWAEDLAP